MSQEVPAAFIDRLLKAVEVQAEASGRIAVLQESQALMAREARDWQQQQAALLVRISDTLTRIEEDQRDGRAAAVQSVKEHAEALAKASGPPKLVGWIIAAGAAIAASALTALATMRGITRHE